jgi:hypothetical protein
MNVRVGDVQQTNRIIEEEREYNYEGEFGRGLVRWEMFVQIPALRLTTSLHVF